MTNELSVEDAIEVFKFMKRDVLEDSKEDKVLDMAIKALEQQPCDDIGELSDGYHTFNQLYHQRAVLFACIVRQNKNKAWKSFKHSDGKYCFDSNGEWFIVGVDTPQGSYTYHYAKEYWDMFDCQELECGKEWDGHTEEDVNRLLSLKQQPCEDCISREELRNLICQHNDKYGYSDRFHEFTERCLQLPSVKPQRPKGKWIYSKYHTWICSVCGENTLKYTGVVPSEEKMKKRWHYCSICGAEMEGEDE